MRFITFSFLCLIAAVTTSGSAMAAAPENLRNKSVTVSWSEEHNQSRDGGEFRDVSVPYVWTCYISSAGRGFGRISIGGRAGGSHETVGKQGQSFGGGAHGATFTGSGMNFMASFGDAARRVSVAFTGSGCTAQVTVAKASGASSTKFTRTDGHTFEIRSFHAGPATCQVQDGNAFAN